MINDFFSILMILGIILILITSVILLIAGVTGLGLLLVTFLKDLIER